MNLTSMSMKRPITSLMICAGILLFGIIALINLPIDLLPDVDFPVITIETRIAGYSPPEVERLITKEIEAMVSTMNHVHRVSSTSSEGLSLVKIEFNLGSNMDYASAEVREKINLIRDSFPKDARNPQIKRYNPSEAPIMIAAVHGDMSAGRLKEVVEERMEKRLQRIEGVGNVEVKGGEKREIIVEVDHGRLKALGLSIEYISSILRANNLSFQVGSIHQQERRWIARTAGQYGDLKEVENIGIRTKDDGPIIYLKDIARVTDGFGQKESIIRFQGEPRVMLYIQKESGANLLNVSRRVQEELSTVQQSLAEALTVETVYDQAAYIQASIDRLRNEAILGGGLALIMIFLFLRSFHGILVVGIAIPVSIIATFSLMYVFNITLNVISLSGFTLGVGMLVDNAIVVIENIFKKRQGRYHRTEASLAATGEVSKAITISTLAHIAVFLPVVFLQKKIRMLYSGLFFTVSFSLLASLAVALTIVPLLSSYLNFTPAWTGIVQPAYYRWYRHLLVVSLKNRGKVLTGGISLFVASLFLIPHLGFESMGRADRGQFEVVVKTPPGTKLSVTDDVARRVEEVLLPTTELKHVSTEVTGETARLRVRLVPKAERLKTTREVVAELRPKVTAIPRTQVHFNIGRGTATGNKIVLEINGYDQKQLLSLAFKVKQRLLKLEDVSDVVIHQSNPKPEMQIRVQHDKAGAYGLNATTIAHAVRSCIIGPIATEWIDKSKEVDLRVRVQPEDTKSATVLGDISIPVLLGDGERALVPLAEVTSFQLTQGMSEIHRKDRHRMIKISGEIGEKDLKTTAAAIEKALEDLTFPEGYSYAFGEDYQEMRKSQKEMIFAFVLAVIFVYMILASLFESFLYPLIIMFSVPMAVIGSLLALAIFGKAISIPVYVGAITLAGIVVNNAIVLVDYINLLKSRGMGKWRAIIKGGESRLRPILMTSGTTLLALLPMALDRGEGAHLWSPLALTIIGGLFTSTVLTLIILPVLASLIKEV
jgi:HAE1 family hydrophobic/amphiphilic exporter-1